MPCEMTKGQDIDKFFVIGCDGEVENTAKTLQEAQAIAERTGACGVLKLLRVCGGEQAYEDILNSLGVSIEAELLSERKGNGVSEELYAYDIEGIEET